MTKEAKRRLADADWLREAYAERTMREVADEIGCSSTSVLRALRRHGIAAKPVGYPPRRPRVAEGDRYGRLTVLREEGMAGAHRAFRCRCDCGAETVVDGANLRTGNTRSCGCLRGLSPLDERRHGHTTGGKSPTFRSWESMRRRCTDSSLRGWKNYGGRGITVCERWDKSFAAFLADLGERPEGTTLDRIDVDGHYEPGNCRWATRKEQEANKRVPRVKRT